MLSHTLHNRAVSDDREACVARIRHLPLLIQAEDESYNRAAAASVPNLLTRFTFV